MKPLRRLSLAEQTAAHLAEGMRSGRWGGVLPGVNVLSRDLHTSRETVRAALRLLENSGNVVANGPGRRRIVAKLDGAPETERRKLRIGILLNEPLVDENAEMQRLLFRIQHGLELAGHICAFSDECQVQLRHDQRRIGQLVARTVADGWIPVGAPIETLQWFAAQPLPSLALGGRSVGVPIASIGSDPCPAILDAVSQLAKLGHRRIVMICPHVWRKPSPGRAAAAFIEALSSHGIVATDYHLPDWEETPDGLQVLLRSLFRLTPPTAMLILEPAHVVASVSYIYQRGLRIGRDVSLISMVDDPAFAWRRPPLAHFKWNTDRFLQHIVGWAESVYVGKPIKDQITFPIEFVPASTVAAVSL